VRIGCQGWNYDDWVTPAGGKYVFYPEGTRQKDMLGLYSSVFDTIEVDSTFYASPSDAVFESWRERTPEGFLFSLKFPRAVTHDLGLRPESFEIADLFCERASILEEKLGVLLIQLPPSFTANKANASALRKFIGRLPSGIRYSVEFRDAAWLVDWTIEELAVHGASVCATEGEWISRAKCFELLADPRQKHAYVRFMGERDLDRFDRVCRPQDPDLAVWADHLKAAFGDREVFVYVSNLFEGFAPATVNKLRVLAGLPESDPAALNVQKSLF